MKKRIIITVAFTACMALCAAVWPQAETVGETPAPHQTPAVSAPEATVVEIKTEAETALSSEKEKAVIPQPEQTQEAVADPQSSSPRSQYLSRKRLMVSPRSELQNRP